MNTMRLVTNEDESDIPADFAAICMDNNGWVGTNNGFPHSGQPALFPIAQAEAIVIAWNCSTGKIPPSMYHPAGMAEGVYVWLGWSKEDVEQREKDNA